MDATVASTTTSSTQKIMVQANGLIHVLSQRDRFLSTYRIQTFTLPDSLIYYILKNQSSSKLYEKLIKTCKYFFIKNPILVTQRAQLIYQNETCRLALDVGESIIFNNLLSRIWIINEINIQDGYEPNFLSFIMPKIYQSDAKICRLWDSNISFNDFTFLFSKSKKVYLNNAAVINDDGTVAALEKILEVLKNIKDFRCDSVSNAITTKTVSELRKLPHFSNLKILLLVHISKSFNIESFYNYIKNNKTTKIFLSFRDQQLSEQYQARLQTIVNEIVATRGREYKPPFIEFSNIDPTSRNNLEELYRQN